MSERTTPGAEPGPPVEGPRVPSEGAGGYPGVGRVLVIIPTYNEIDNLDMIVGRVRAAVPSAEILVTDDNSPDGTGRRADELAAEDTAVHVLHRPGKEGLGAAYLAGFGWAAEHGYDAVVEMDADGSHAPEELPKLLDALRTADMVLGCPGARIFTPGSRSACRSRTLPEAIGPTGCQCWKRSTSTRSPPRATASKSTLRGGRTVTVSG
jgi:cellulose synthase/poly-beta-1,6-N-acetylglucosamine synthase-like glycosyltransferase